MTSTNDYITDKRVQYRRRHARSAASGHVVAQVLSAKGPQLIGHTFHSSIVEVSPCGIRLITAIPLENCILDLFVKINGLPRTMLIKTEVRWVSLEAPGVYYIGAEICDTPASDTQAWCEFQRDLED
jgi:hypothetical protein